MTGLSVFAEVQTPKRQGAAARTRSDAALVAMLVNPPAHPIPVRFFCADQFDEAPPGNLGDQGALIGHAIIHDEMFK